MNTTKGLGVEEQVISLISEVGPVTYLEMAELLGINKKSSNERLTRLHKAGVLHISGWTKGNRFHMARFDLGLTNDAPKPPRKDPNICRKEWEIKMKKQRKWPGLLKKWENARTRQKVRKSGKINIPIHRDPILAALMGV